MNINWIQYELGPSIEIKLKENRATLLIVSVAAWGSWALSISLHEKIFSDPCCEQRSYNRPNCYHFKSDSALRRNDFSSSSYAGEDNADFFVL